jgi:hypothetical protein
MTKKKTPLAPGLKPRKHRAESCTYHKANEKKYKTLNLNGWTLTRAKKIEVMGLDPAK